MFNKQESHFLGEIGRAAKAAGDKLPEKFVPLDEWDDELSHSSHPVIELEMRSAADGRVKPLQRVGASPDAFSVVPQKVREAADKASLRFAKSTNETTSMKLNDALSKLRDELKEGLVEGDPIAHLKERVKDVFDNADDDRAELIARSETSRAVHEGQRIAAKESGVVKGFKLLVSSDACDVCSELADKEVGLDDGKFNDANDYDDIPLSSSLAVSAVDEPLAKHTSSCVKSRNDHFGKRGHRG